MRDEPQRIDDLGTLFPRNPEPFHRSQAHTYEDVVELALQVIEGDCRTNLRLAELYAERADQVDFAEAVGRTEFVFGDAIRIEPAGERAVIENGDGTPVAAQLRGTRQR